MALTPTPSVGDELAWVARHLEGLWDGPLGASRTIRGGQTAADAALAGFDVSGYAARRNEVWPPSRRGASRLSPWIRHGLLPLPRVWEAVADGPRRDVRKFRDELLWQEYARHRYARLGTGDPIASVGGKREVEPWDRSMACVGRAVEELERTGWVTNQTRMWLASHWTVRHRGHVGDGEDQMYRRLLDGSRAANRLGWGWVSGAATGTAYGFSRWQVEKRAPGLCEECPHRRACPIDGWPPTEAQRAPRPMLVAHDPDPAATAGPVSTPTGREAEVVWLTAESLGDGDPALAAHPDLPAVFVFDAPLLARLRLAASRLVFLAECLADLGTRRPVEVRVGDPVVELAGRRVGTTFAPVPGWRRRAAALVPVAVHPWPWLVPPGPGSVASFSAWRKAVGA
ncbi:MAG: FAD-binding domain-containing protein [Acidimicrobiia bacterium]